MSNFCSFFFYKVLFRIGINISIILSENLIGAICRQFIFFIEFKSCNYPPTMSDLILVMFVLRGQSVIDCNKCVWMKARLRDRTFFGLFRFYSGFKCSHHKDCKISLNKIVYMNTSYQNESQNSIPLFRLRVSNIK